MKPSIAIRAAWPAAIVAAYVFAGCGSDDKNDSASSSSAESETSSLIPGASSSSGSNGAALRCSNRQPTASDDYEAVIKEIQTLYCQRQWECCQPNERPLAGDSLQDCLDDVGRAIPDSNSDDEDSMRCGRILFLRDKADACLEQLRSGTCADVRNSKNCLEDRNGPETARVLWQATSQTGEACESYGLDCADGYCDTGTELTGRGKCAPWKSADTSCKWDKECVGGLCAGGKTCGHISVDDNFCSRQAELL
jgi:hypothetical protein